LIAGTAYEYLALLQEDLNVVCYLDPDHRIRQLNSAIRATAQDRTYKEKELKMYLDLRAVPIAFIASFLLYSTPFTKHSATPGNPSHPQLEDLNKARKPILDRYGMGRRAKHLSTLWDTVSTCPLDIYIHT
jgi:hypothetical protein